MIALHLLLNPFIEKELMKNYLASFLLISLITFSSQATAEVNKVPIATPVATKTPIETSAKETQKELPSTLLKYLQLLHDKPETFGPFGKWQNSEIEISLNPEQILKIQNQTRLRMLAHGYGEEEAEKWSSVGIVAEDNYWMWVRDAVIFPSGVYGTYDRIMVKSGLEGVPGAVVLPILSTKKIIVNVCYRHATRDWEIEITRGHSEKGETPEKTAARELQEETGYQVSKFTYLGTIAPNTGMLLSQLPVYCAEVNHSGETNREYSEAIMHNPAFSKEEIKQGFARGYIEVMIKGHMTKVNCRDPFLAFAILQAEMKGLL